MHINRGNLEQKEYNMLVELAKSKNKYDSNDNIIFTTCSGAGGFQFFAYDKTRLFEVKSRNFSGHHNKYYLLSLEELRTIKKIGYYDFMLNKKPLENKPILLQLTGGSIPERIKQIANYDKSIRAISFDIDDKNKVEFLVNLSINLNYLMSYKKNINPVNSGDLWYNKEKNAIFNNALTPLNETTYIQMLY